MLEAAIITAAVIIDQLTKMWVSSSLGADTLRIIPGLINFQYVENKGMAFGMFQNGTLILSILTGVFICLMFFLIYRYRKKTTRFFNVCLAVIAGGAIGNFIDRVAIGYVVDFIEFAFVDFAVFNFADICVTVGAAVLVLYIIFSKRGRNVLKALDGGKEKKDSGNGTEAN